MSDDKRFEAFLRDAAREHYNPPPDTPGDEMWTEVRAARDGRQRSRRPVPWGWAAAVAAALVLGVALGRGLPGWRSGPSSAAGPRAPSGAVLAGPQSAAGRSEDPASARAAGDLFSRSEVLLALLSTEGDTDEAATSGEVRAWARPLLQRTRILLDSPAAADPAMHRLLEDLELILAQIVTLEPGDTLDWRMVEQGVRSRDLLFRLRAAAGAGPAVL